MYVIVYVIDMVSVDDAKEFLSFNPDYIKTFKKAIENEKTNSKNPHYLGWTWYDVETYGAKLQRLVVNGFIKVNFKSRSATCYRLKDDAKEQIADALKSFLPPKEYNKLRARPW